MVDLINIWDDDWGLKALHPLAAARAVGDDIRMSIDASTRNQGTSGYGWTGVHVVTLPETSYVHTGLLLADATEALAGIMPRVSRFYVTNCQTLPEEKADPDGSYDDDAWCFGYSSFCYIKLDVIGDHVERIWFDLRETDILRIAAMREAVVAIDRLVPSLLVDYVSEAAGLIGDNAFLDRYFSET